MTAPGIEGNVSEFGSVEEDIVSTERALKNIDF